VAADARFAEPARVGSAIARRRAIVTDANWLTAGEIAAAYRAKRLSPVELVQALLDRIAKVDAKLNAFIRVDGEAALDAARLAEKEIASGRARGPLHGVPIGIKDIIDVAGQATTCHSKIMLEHVAKEDAEVIRRLRSAGAIPLGKLSLHEFAIGGPSFDLPFPPARNPWQRGHHPGGSSSGSGAALAAGMVPLALGTDTGGSVRNPAGACGIVGLKPTYGLVSRRGVFPLSFTLDHVGPMARSVGDIALVLDAIAGHDPGDPGSSSAPTRAFGRDLERGLRGLRIGFVRRFHQSDLPADPEMAAAIDAAAHTLQSEGAELREVSLPPLVQYSGVQRVVMLAESWAIHSKWLQERPGDYGALARRRLMGGAFLSAGDYVHAQQRRAELMAAVDDAFRDFDVLLVANAMDPACAIDDEEAVARTYPRQARNVFNLTGHPAIALMSGLSKAGLPLSIQLVGKSFDEATLLRAAAGYERATEWHTRRPPV
jgi:aspartyl-tRNA(Asn)/glutamyl-tRNA(Gln) amidotransferase subunit A